MKRLILPFAFLLGGCAFGTVTENDAEKNKKEFSQESYEQAMIAAGKGKELEEEKKRNDEYLSGQSR